MTTISEIEALARDKLIEPTPRFWSSDEITKIIVAGIRDLWRSIVDLKAEHYLVVNDTDVYLGAGDSQLSGVPSDVHKVYLIEPRDVTDNSTNRGIAFLPKDYNHPEFRAARARGAIDAINDTILYSITSQGAPVGAPIIRTAPKVSSQINLSFSYVPSLGSAFTTNSVVPIPGEADNALMAWAVAFARSKESEDRSPDANWLSIYATEKQNLLESLGLRQLQEPEYVDAIFQSEW